MLKLAWRNIWRNKRRTLITSASVFFGVILSALMSSMQEGSYDMYIKAIVNFYSGYIQIHKKGYWDDKTINNLLEYTPIKPKLEQVNGVSQFTPRLENFALASMEEITKGVMVIGIRSSTEDKITQLSKKIIQGKFMIDGDSGIILGSSLAKYMNIIVNDTLVLLSQGYHGVSAAGKYPVRGIIKHPAPQMDRTVVYMDIEGCQEFFSAQDKLTSIVIMVNNPENVEPAKNELSENLGNNYEVMDWKEMNSMLLKEIESDRSSGVIMKGILFVIIAFGIFGTIMMMTLERRKEFGVLIAVGMQKSKLYSVLVLETIMIGLVGSISGIVACIPITWYLSYHPIPLTGQAADYILQMGFEPIMPFSTAPSIFYYQGMTVLVFTLLISLYPVLSTQRLKVNKALRG